MRSRFVLSLSIVLAAFAIAHAGDWPQWRGPNRDGVSTEKGLLQSWPKGGPTLLWNSKEVNKSAEKGKNVGSGWSTLSIAGDGIYTMGLFGKDIHVVCLDRESGKVRWSTAIGGNRGDGPRCTPTVDGKLVYAVTSAGEIACVAADKGTIVWKKDYTKEFGGKSMANWNFCESPLVDGDKVICTPGGEQAGVVALDKLTGATIWKSEIKGSGGCGYSSLVVAEVAGVRQYVTFMGGGKGLVGVDAKSGTLLWHYKKVANGTGNISTPIVKGDLVFASTSYGTGAALLQLVPDGKGGVDAKERYFLSGKALQNHHGQMILVGDYIYGGHGQNLGHPFCLHMETGKFAWGPIAAAEHPGGESAAVAFADGNMYFRWQNNTMGLVEASPGGYVLKGQFDLPGGMERGWPQPVILDGKLYVRGNNQVLCYDVRAK